MDEYQRLSHTRWSANFMSYSYRSAEGRRCMGSCDRILERCLVGWPGRGRALLRKGI